MGIFIKYLIIGIKIKNKNEELGLYVLQMFNFLKIWSMEVFFHLPSHLWHAIERWLGTLFIMDFSGKRYAHFERAIHGGAKTPIKAQAVNPYHLCLWDLVRQAWKGNTVTLMVTNQFLNSESDLTSICILCSDPSRPFTMILYCIVYSVLEI